MNVYVTGIDLSDNKNVLLLPPESMSDEDNLELRNVLLEKFPGCNFVVLTGGFQAVATTGNSIQYEIEE